MQLSDFLFDFFDTISLSRTVFGLLDFAHFRTWPTFPWRSPGIKKFYCPYTTLYLILIETILGCYQLFIHGHYSYNCTTLQMWSLLLNLPWWKCLRWQGSLHSLKPFVTVRSDMQKRSHTYQLIFNSPFSFHKRRFVILGNVTLVTFFMPEYLKIMIFYIQT